METCDDLTTVFQLFNPATHELFKYSKEINEVGFSLIATCYAEGIKRLNSIYNQEILKTEEKVVKGQRSCNVNVSNKTINNEINSPPTKRIRRATSKNAKEILSQLLAHTTFPDNDQLLYDVLHELQDIELGWTKERAMIYWQNHHNKNKQNM
ncbi:16384_t:CDS:2 [Gigaspora rosea]|nr:16384_t:CDS:2 [Gigaspora rosea]